MSLTQDQLRHFMDEGFTIVEGALTGDELDPVIAGIEAFVDERAQALHREGRIAELHENEPFERRLALITRENTAIYDDIDIMNMRAEAVFRFLGNARMLDLVESLVGPEITCSPIQHLRAKLPEGLNSLPGHGNGGDNGRDGGDNGGSNGGDNGGSNGGGNGGSNGGGNGGGNGGSNGGGNGEDDALAARIRENVAPWHQDAQVHHEDADPVFILTVWLPLCDTDEENGCLQIIPRVHHSRTVYWSEGFGIEE
ncbi:MAG: phytanoyl-CoA dioxygenase family protein, partial [Gammaproteobacteria bacterium]|nr:phytanoyl-CoA dioxygenase family protein [Gammaproteobacteria bacterium]